MLHILRLQIQTARMMVDAQTVAGIRMMELSGLMPAAQGEALRKHADTQMAMADAWVAGAASMLSRTAPEAAAGDAPARADRSVRT